MPRQKNTAAVIQAAQLQAKALELRRSGLGFVEIAGRLGISRSQAHRYVVAGLASARQVIGAQAEELRTEQVSRLDALLEAVWLKARAGNMPAVDRALRIMERRDKLLGIEAPIRIETTGKDGAPIEVQSTQTIDPSRLTTAALQELLDARIVAGA